MTQAARFKASYVRMLQETVFIRRYTGQGGSEAFTDYETRGRVTGYEAKALVGQIAQGDRRAVIYADDLVTEGMALPVLTFDKLVADGGEMAIIDVIPRKALDGTLIAYELQVRGP